MSLKLFIIYLSFMKIISANKTIGAIFDDGNFLLAAAFNVAIEMVSENRENAFEAKVVVTPPGDILEAENAMCNLLESNVFGILGPTNRGSLEHIQSMADYIEMPHIIFTSVETQTRNWSTVNVYPDHKAYSQVFADIIKIKEWNEFTVIYEGAELLPFLDNILSTQNEVSAEEMTIHVVQLPDSDDYRSQLKTIKSSGSVNYLVDCSAEKLPQFLQQAQQVGLMSDDHSYIIMDPDFQTIDINPYKHGGSNITGIRFFDVSLEPVQDVIKSINEKVKELSEDMIDNAIEEDGLSLSLALVHDAALVYASALDNLGIEEGANFTCDSGESWAFGTSVINYLRTVEVDGITGTIKFDEDGFRSDFEVEVVEVAGHGLEKVGVWTAEDGFEDKRIIIPVVEDESTDSMKGKHFLILTALSAPYGMLRESTTKLDGNARYEGFGIELIEILAKMNEFNYTFEIQEDGNYGNYNPKTKTATGMMDKIMKGNADFAITDLTITASRQKAVDFTSPFLNLGITILYKKPTKEPPKLFSFVKPFSFEVWGYIAGTYAGVSLLFFVLGRLAPEEWQNPYPCIEEPETLDNQFTLANSFWYTLGSILTQGSEIAPIGLSTRMLGSMWFFFVLIMNSSYTANLAVFLTVESKFYAIKSVSDLAETPHGITYGAKSNGATFTFFKESDNPLYQKMYEYMDSHPEYMTGTNDAGLERVKSDDINYAFLMESTSIDYVKERNCDVTQVGSLLDSKGYGIAMKKNSPYRQPMSESILQLQEQGVLTRLKEKWWKEKRGGGSCVDDDDSSTDAQPLKLANVGGVFIVLVAGSAMATVFAFGEFIFDVWCTSRREQVSFKEELMAEAKLVFSFDSDIKPVRYREKESESSESGSKKEEEKKNEDVEAENNNGTLEPTPTSRSLRNSHYSCQMHSRRPSLAVQLAMIRRDSRRSS